MVQYVRKNVPLISKELISIDDVEAFIERSEYSVIGEFVVDIVTIVKRYFSIYLLESWMET